MRPFHSVILDVSPTRLFPDKAFPRQDIFPTRRFLDRTFPRCMFNNMFTELIGQGLAKYLKHRRAVAGWWAYSDVSNVELVVVVTLFNENFDNRKATFGNQTSKTKYSIGLNGEAYIVMAN